MLAVTFLLASNVCGQIKIRTQSDLQRVSKNPKASYLLMNDIALSGEWIPIIGFEGVFDGGGHAISNLTVSSARDGFGGLFATSHQAVIRNLVIKNAHINASLAQGKGRVGILLGEARGTVIECCSIERGKVSGGGYVGSLVGLFLPSATKRNQIVNCYSNAEVVALSGCAGGLVGGADRVDVRNSCFAGTVCVDSGTGFAGGVLGVSMADTSTIQGCVATGFYVKAATPGRIVGAALGTAQLHLQLNFANKEMKIGSTSRTLKTVSPDQVRVDNLNGSNIPLGAEEFVSDYPDYTPKDIDEAWKGFKFNYLDACTDRHIFSALPRENAKDKRSLAAIWIQAIYWDMAMNRFLQTKSQSDRRLVDSLYEGNYKYYSNFDFHNDDPNTGWFIYDDIMWWTGALSRAYSYFRSEKEAVSRYLKYAESSYRRVLFGSAQVGDPGSWDRQHGGMFWNWSKPSQADWSRRDNGKAACINFPTVIAATTLFRMTSQKEYLAQAREIYDWAKSNLVRADGYVYDMYHARPGGHDNLYNSGTAIGAAVSLYQLTKDIKYLNDAILVADYVKNIKCATTEGFLPVCYGEEQSVYAAIFIQYISLLIRDCGQYQYLPWLRYNINAGWAHRNRYNITCPDFRVKAGDNMTWAFSENGREKTRTITSYDASAIPAMMLLVPPKSKMDLTASRQAAMGFYSKGLRWDMKNIWDCSSEGFPVLRYQ